MNIDFTAEELEFQREVRTFFEENYPKDIQEKIKNNIHPTKDDFIRWQKILNDKGWLAENWPVEYGGTGWSPTQKYIVQQEKARAHVLGTIPFGVTMVAPVIYTYGSEEQKKRFLPDILESNAWWCQGYSEPGAGSDLAALKTSAVRDGDDYIVNGTKTWTTLGHWAEWMFCLVRTDPDAPKKQQGISFILIDMSSPGISVSPILTLDEEREVNEVHFDNVRVPAANLIGEENQGWTYAKLLLTHERTSIANVQNSKKRLEKVKSLAQQTPDHNGENSLWDDSQFRTKLANVELDLTALEYTELRTLAAVASGGAPGPESSILKIKGTEVMQAIDELFVELAGYHVLPFTQAQYHDGFEGERIGDWFETNTGPHYFNNRKQSIFGGTNEIQKGIICKAVLGL
ncbi:MAG: acyl-CoA dehydrogenase family protein [Cellvibrionaceae bacterium]|nr:acyl-CoA dehydrogenase family protein [Cellvibrionaceae bacterium]